MSTSSKTASGRSRRTAGEDGSSNSASSGPDLASAPVPGQTAAAPRAGGPQASQLADWQQALMLPWQPWLTAGQGWLQWWTVGLQAGVQAQTDLWRTLTEQLGATPPWADQTQAIWAAALHSLKPQA